MIGEEESTLVLFYSPPGFFSDIIYCHSPNTALWYQNDDMTVLWCKSQFPEPSLDLLALLHTCPQHPLFKSEWGWWSGCSRTWNMGGQRQVPHSSFLSSQLIGLLLLSSKTDELSRSTLHEGRYMGYPEPKKWKRRKKSWRRLSYACTWHCSVSYGVKLPGMKSTQQIKSALAFSPSEKGIQKF